MIQRHPGPRRPALVATEGLRAEPAVQKRPVEIPRPTFHDMTSRLSAIERAHSYAVEARKEKVERDTVRARMDGLTAREREVMMRVVTGRLNKQIAGDLGTVEKTIKVHRARVMTKMQVHSVAALVRAVETAGVELPAAR